MPRKVIVVLMVRSSLADQCPCLASSRVRSVWPFWCTWTCWYDSEDGLSGHFYMLVPMILGLPGDKGDFGEKGMGGEDTYGMAPSMVVRQGDVEHVRLGPRGNNGIPGRTGCKFDIHCEWAGMELLFLC